MGAMLEIYVNVRKCLSGKIRFLKELSLRKSNPQRLGISFANSD